MSKYAEKSIQSTLDEMIYLRKRQKKRRDNWLSLHGLTGDARDLMRVVKMYDELIKQLKSWKEDPYQLNED